MALPGSPPKRYTTSRQLIGGDDFNKVSDQLYSVQTLTASTVQTQAGAVANAQINAAAVALTVNNGNDVAALPPGYAGLEVFVTNLSGANSTNIYPSGTDQINDGGAGTLIAQAAGKSAIYKCIVGATSTAGAKWYRNLSA